MRLSAIRLAASIFAATIIANACGGNSDSDARVAELEKQLEESQKQLTETAKQDAAAPPVQPSIPPQPPTEVAAAASPPPDTAPAPAKPKTVPAKPKTPPESQKYAADQDARAKAEAQRLLDEQQAVNAKQAETIAQLKEQVESLKPKEFTLPAGTIIPVRTSGELSSDDLSNGSTFDAVLDRDVTSDETVIAKAGTRVTGVVVESDPGGRVKGVASLTVGVRSLVGAGKAVISVRTDTFTIDAESTKKKDAVRTGVATGVGALIGGIAGGGKGAAIGAGTGAAAGVGISAATRGAAAVIPAEQLIEFRLTAPATVVIQPEPPAKPMP